MQLFNSIPKVYIFVTWFSQLYWKDILITFKHFSTYVHI